MRKPRSRVLLGLAVVALLLSAVDAAGSRWWRSTTGLLAWQPEAGAERLATGAGLSLPEAVRRSRWLDMRDLAAAPRQRAIASLERLSRLQRRWFPTDPLADRNAASAALIEGRLARASALLDAALVRDPTSPMLYRLRALVRWGEGRRHDALDDLAEAASLAPGLNRPRLELPPEDAAWVRREGLQRALERYPRQRVRTLLSLADVLRDQGLTDEARALLEAEPPNPEIDLELAVLDRRDGRLDEAAARLSELANRPLLPSPLRARAWSDLAIVRALAGDPAGAETAARTALTLAPNSTAPYLALAQLAEQEEDWVRALEQLRRAWGLAPADPRLLVRVAAAAEKAGELPDARLALERAVELEPDVPSHAVRLVEFHIRNGQYLEATLRLSRALDRFPTEPRLLRQLDRLRQLVR